MFEKLKSGIVTDIGIDLGTMSTCVFEWIRAEYRSRRARCRNGEVEDGKGGK